MKRIISLLLAVMMLAVTTVATGASAYAAAAPVKYEAQKQQYNSQNAAFNFADGKSVKVVYNYKTKRYEGYYSKALTNKGKVLFTTKYPTGVAISGKYIYYTDSAKGGIMRIKTNGKGKTRLIKVKKNTYDIKFLICGTRLVYNLIQYKPGTIEIARTKLYTATLKGKNVKRIAKNVKTNCYSYNGYLYFGKGKNLYRYSFSDSKLSTRNVGLSLEKADLAGMEGSTLYLHYIYDEAEKQQAFYRVDVEKQRYWKFCNLENVEFIHGTLVYEKKVYALIGNNVGNDFAAITNEKPDSKPYQKLYTLGGDSMGFYKNTIVMDNFTVDKTVGDYAFDKYVVVEKLK